VPIPSAKDRTSRSRLFGRRHAAIGEPRSCEKSSGASSAENPSRGRPHVYARVVDTAGPAPTDYFFAFSLWGIEWAFERLGFGPVSVTCRRSREDNKRRVRTPVRPPPRIA